MTRKGQKGNNFNPAGIFDWCTSRDQVVDYSINLAKQVFIKKGYRIFIPDNPDTGGDSDFTIEKYPEVALVSCKSTPQFSKWGDKKPFINIRTNSTGKNNYGSVKTPTNYHYMIGIASDGTSCIWTKEDLAGNKCGITWGCKNGIVEDIVI